MTTSYVLLADTLTDIQAMLSPGLEWSNRRPIDPSDVLEVWFIA